MPRILTALWCLAVLGLFITRPASAADEGAKVFQESCLPCHTPKSRPLDNMHLTREQWKIAVDRMLDQGAEVPKGKMEVLLDYLSRANGPAPADSNHK